MKHYVGLAVFLLIVAVAGADSEPVIQNTWLKTLGAKNLIYDPTLSSAPMIIPYDPIGANLITLLEAHPNTWIAENGFNNATTTDISWSWSAGQMSVAGYGAGPSPLITQHIGGGVAAGDVTVQVTLGGSGAGSVVVVIANRDGSVSEFTTLSSASSLTHTFENVPEWDLIFVSNVGGNNTIIDDIEVFAAPKTPPANVSTIKVPWFTEKETP